MCATPGQQIPNAVADDDAVTDIYVQGARQQPEKGQEIVCRENVIARDQLQRGIVLEQVDGLTRVRFLAGGGYRPWHFEARQHREQLLRAGQWSHLRKTFLEGRPVQLLPSPHAWVACGRFPLQGIQNKAAAHADAEVNTPGG